MSQHLTVSIAQLNPIVGNFRHNTQLVIDAIHHAKEEGADVVVFPELVITGYPPEDLLFRPAFLAQVERALDEIVTATQGITAIIGAPLMRDNQLFNMACILQNGQSIAEYAKQHLPNYRVFDEKRYFTAGERSVVVDIAGYSVGLLICEDIWMREPIAALAKENIDAVIVLNASPFRLNKTNERLTMLTQRASDHHLPIVYVNLVGGQDELVFDGESLLIDQQGQLLFQAPTFEAGVFTQKLPLSTAGTACAVRVVSDEACIYQALVQGVKDYVHKNGFPGVMLGLSGGIDSALTLAIAVDALGAENVEAIMMPFKYTADISIEDAAKQAVKLGVKYREISIEPIFDRFMSALSAEFAGLERDVTEENIQARSRGVLLMAMSNKLGKMLLATGNKSEMSVGYATLYGDMAGGFAPLKDVFKTIVYDLSRYRNSLGDGEIIPDRVITRPPSAELAPDQKDEDSLPPYDILDEVLRLFIEEFHSVDDIVAQGFDFDTVHRVANLVLLSEYKRRQSAPGVRITKRAFGKDRRYPITSHYRYHLSEQAK
ncbi:MAG: NAD+ synthase [Aquificaceae bacterium]|nr:MAG: NAD+ synthase [Aquificaceae bacterium]